MLLLAWVLISVQLAVRAWLVGERHLYGDDLEYGTLANELPLFSSDYLLESHGGHFMPGALLLSGTLARFFPLDWTAVTVTLLLLQLLASYAVLRLLRTIMGDRPAVLIPLAVYLFSPLSLGSFTWWAAAMNSVPLQAGLAWYAADALLLARTGRMRYAVTGTLALVLALGFYERAVLLPPLAGALVWLLHHARGVPAPLRSALRDAGMLWTASLAVLAGWAWLFLSAAPTEAVASPTTLDQALALSGHLTRNLVPALAGGPWTWSDLGGAPLADAPDGLVAGSTAVLAVLVLWTSWYRRSGALVWLLFGGFFAVGAALVAVGRGGAQISGVLPLTYRYFAADAVVFALALGVLFALPRRRSAPPPKDGPARPSRHAAASGGRGAGRSVVPVIVLVTVAAFLVSSLVSTVSYERAWRNEPTTAYLDNALASLASAGEEPLLDQEVPAAVLWSLAAPYNRVSRVFLAVEDRPEFADASHELRMLDDAGRLAPARIKPGVPVRQGPAGGCGWPVAAGATTTVPLDASLPGSTWTAELTYTAATAGDVRVALGDGTAVSMPVRAGEHTVYLRLEGDGDAFVVTGAPEGMSLCIRSGLVGEVEPR